MTRFRTLCLQCSLKALLDNEDPPVFDESVDAHLKRVHPDPIEAQRERLDLECRLMERWNIEKQHTKDELGPRPLRCDVCHAHAMLGRFHASWGPVWACGQCRISHGLKPLK